jgi:hypothetical protein
MRRYGCELLLLVLVLVASGLSLSWYAPLTIDDAFITFTYSKRAAFGEGLVFNRGEHVEATSSMLWALLLIPFELLGIGSVIGSKILGGLFFLGSLAFTYRGVSHFLPSFPAPASRRCYALAACLMVAMSAAYVAWTLQGMENALVAFLLIYGLFQFSLELESRSGVRSFLPIALLGWARPEGFAFYGVFLFLRLAFGAWRGLLVSRWLIGWCLGLLLVLVPYELWGLSYYGTLLPNTVGAKVGGVDYARLVAGVDYLLSYSASQAAWMGVLAILGVGILLASALIRRGNIPNSRALFILVPCAMLLGLQLSFAIITGGDWMPGGRFVSHMAPVLSLGAVLAFTCLGALWVTPGGSKLLRIGYHGLGAIFLAAYLTHGVLATLRDQPIAAWVNQNSENAIRPIVRKINKEASAEDVIACSDIGRIGYYFPGSVFDWWGLASPEVVALGQAMGKIAPQTVLSKKPRYIVLYGATPDLFSAEGQGGFGGMSKPFVENEEFRQWYNPVLTTQFTHGRHHILFERLKESPQP